MDFNHYPTNKKDVPLQCSEAVEGSLFNSTRMATSSWSGKLKSVISSDLVGVDEVDYFLPAPCLDGLHLGEE